MNIRNFLRTIMFALMALLLAFGGLSPATAANDTADWVVGQLDTYDDARILQAALCSKACIETSGNNYKLSGITAVGDEDDYTFEDVPYGNYAIAVLYELLDDGGTPVMTGAAYLRDHDQGRRDSTIVGKFSDGSKLRVRAERLAMGSRWIKFIEKPVPPKKDPKVRVNYLGGSVLGDTVGLAFKLRNMTPKAVVAQKAYGCGGRVIARKRITGERGSYRYNFQFSLQKTAPTLKVLTVVSQPTRKIARSTLTIRPVPGAHCR